MKDKPFVAPSERAVLIFRRGSIGDAVVSVPALNEIARRHPHAQRWILTNLPVMETAAAIQTVLENSTLVHGFISLPPGGGGWPTLKDAIRRIRALGPDRLIYLSEPSGFAARIQEWLFFRLCGIRDIVGMSPGNGTATYRPAADGLWEAESSRLLRAIGAESAAPDWTFPFLDSERAEAVSHLASWPGRSRYILFSLGAKLPDKDWGDANWTRVLAALSQSAPDLGIVAIGAADESARTRRVLGAWRGPSLDLCGRTAPRISALVGDGAIFYLGHDSGPMHLAALVGTPCIAVFSARAKPGVWFPHGHRNRIFYPWAAEPGIPARAGFRSAGTSIGTIEPDQVLAAARELLATPARS